MDKFINFVNKLKDESNKRLIESVIEGYSTIMEGLPIRDLGYQPMQAVLPLSSPLNDRISGGKADNMTIEQIAEKHGVCPCDIEDQLKKGIRIELEHTSDPELAAEIAMDHLDEIPDYYTRLDTMEADAGLED